jgi:excisionase family DNA binding protein
MITSRPQPSRLPDLTGRVAVSPLEFARAAGVSLPTVQRRLRDGTIRAGRIGRRVTIPVTELRRLVGEVAA